MALICQQRRVRPSTAPIRRAQPRAPLQIITLAMKLMQVIDLQAQRLRCQAPLSLRRNCLLAALPPQSPCQVALRHLP